MDALCCVTVAGVALVPIAAVIPRGFCTRHVLNSAASWPEPMAILLTIVLTFFGSAACCRAGTHMSVTIEQVVREIWPFYGVMSFVLMLVTYIPSVSLWLPRMLGL
jgi:TRAP-type C4-dicarboxylate transport system permease small subunit